MAETLIVVKDLVKHFPITGGVFNRPIASVRAVDSVSFSITANRTLGIVGESGCGKSTLARLLNLLIRPTSGSITYRGENIFDYRGKQLKNFRQKVQMVFQDPYSSLNPRFSMFDIIAEPLRVHAVGDRTSQRRKVRSLIDKVGLSYEYRHRFPHEFSGGQRQRIGIARALALDPQVLICDEPVSALDVSVQAQVLNLIMDLQEEFKLTVLFISHDLSVINKISDQVIVLYFGKIIEMGNRVDIFSKQLHPYAQALFSAIPKATPHEQKERVLLEVEPPSPRNFPSGCRFHPRCSQVMDRCRQRQPELAGNNHQVACHLYN